MRKIATATLAAAAAALAVTVAAPIPAAAGGTPVTVNVPHHVAHRAIVDGARQCRSEDDPRPCVWDARHRGNGAGRSFITVIRPQDTRAVSACKDAAAEGAWWRIPARFAACERL